MPTDIVPLPRARLGQNEAAVKAEAIRTRPCPYCEAAIGEPCYRPGLDGRRYEITYIHPCRGHEPRPEGNADA
jgi:hypothetical protein